MKRRRTQRRVVEQANIEVTKTGKTPIRSRRPVEVEGGDMLGRLRVDSSVTYPVGDSGYSFVKIGVSLELPTGTSEDDIWDRFEFISDTVDSLMAEETDRVMGSD